jgi:hypothetical protein
MHAYWISVQTSPELELNPFEQAFEQAFEPCFEREPTVLVQGSSNPLVEPKVQFSVLQICSENSN